MGCCLPRLAKPDDVLNPNDGTLCFRTISGGLKARKDNVQQSWPAGTLFITDRALIYFCKNAEVQRISFNISEISNLKVSSALDNNRSIPLLFFSNGAPNGYIIFEVKTEDQQFCEISISVRDCKRLADQIHLKRKNIRKTLSAIKEEAEQAII